jgi:hypothetical protein
MRPQSIAAIHALCDFSDWLGAPSTAAPRRLLLAPEAAHSLEELGRPAERSSCWSDRRAA